MKSYPIAIFKAKLSQILALVIGGQDVIVTDHNHPVAKVSSLRRFPPLPAADLSRLLGLPLIKLKKSHLSSTELVRKLRDE